jgi:hypothetical protein
LLLYSNVPDATVAFTVTEFNVPPVQFDIIDVITGLGFTVTVITLLATPPIGQPAANAKRLNWVVWVNGPDAYAAEVAPGIVFHDVPPFVLFCHR